MKQRNDGFTLIELLVVISIIAILMAVLLPVLEAARKQARLVGCQSRLRQHGIAHNTYKTDHDGFFPAFGGPAKNDYANFFRTGASGHGALQSLRGSAERVYLADYADAGSTWKSQSLFRCPLISWRTPWPEPHPYPSYTMGRYEKALPGGNATAGYAFYTGRKWHASGSHPNYDTRIRRNRGDEILMTDLATWWGWNAPGFFTPHAGPTAMAKRTGSLHALTADGAVTVQSFTDTESTLRNGNQQLRNFAVRNKVGPGSSRSNGPFYVIKR